MNEISNKERLYTYLKNNKLSSKTNEEIERLEILIKNIDNKCKN